MTHDTSFMTLHRQNCQEKPTPKVNNNKIGLVVALWRKRE